MRRILFLILGLLIFPSASLGATASTTLTVNGEGLIPDPAITTPYVAPEYDDEGNETVAETRGVVTFPAVSGTNYTFETATAALEFASNPRTYIEDNYDFGSFTDPDGYGIEYYDIEYDPTLRTAITDITVHIMTGNVSETVDTRSYTVLRTINFTASPSTLTAPYGGRHFIAGSDAVTFTGITFDGETYGGGVTVTSGTATFTGCSWRNCDVSDNGGAVSVTGGNATITSATFTGNTASDGGGAVSVSGGSLTLSGTFSGNSAYSGGAVSVTGGSMTLTSSTFTGNTATNGGAVYSSSGLTLGAGVTFNSVSASSPNVAERGGAIYVSGGTLTVSGSGVSFTENTAEYGGAIYVSSGTVEASGSSLVFTGNVASDDGGAMWLGASGRVNFTGEGLAVTGNVAVSGDGGGIYSSGTVTLGGSNPEFSGNTADDGRGGAVCMAGGSTLNLGVGVSFTGNSANYGGAIGLLTGTRNPATVNMSGSGGVTFTRNIALMSGGGIYAEDNCVIVAGSEVTFTDNTARSGNGGAMWASDASEFPEGTVYFSGNTAGSSLSDYTSETWPSGGNGGALYSPSSSGTVIGTGRNYLFTGTNTAKYHGGAVCTYSGDIVIQGYVLSRSITVRNSAGIGGGLAASYSGTVTVNNCSVMNQAVTYDGSGGAIWAKNVSVNSCDFGSEELPNTSRGGANTGGGAIYIHDRGTGTLNNSTFSYNVANNKGSGGAVYAYYADVTIRNSYFHDNRAEGGNGGAVILSRTCTTSIISSTFINNKSDLLNGGAVYSEGTITISRSYFAGNQSFMSGGAVYYSQGNGSDASFTISNSMLTDNSTEGGDTGGYGGGLYILAVRATITACTFTKNRVSLSGNEGEGGAVYLNTEAMQNGANRIENCTFYANTLDDGAANDEADGTVRSGGGGLSVHCEGLTRIVSCTFTENVARYGGGALYVAKGNVSLAGTITVGNARGLYDIWADGNISSGGYNRIGVYGTGSGFTDFYSVARNDTDRTAYPSKGWTRTTFFGDNVLAENLRDDIGDDVPPLIGSSRAGQVRLLTLMLDEEETLPLVDRATNIIPYSRRTSFPDTDERGVSRASDSGEINLDVGACFFDGTRPSDNTEPEASYTISRLEISGIPNNLRRVGQTASLVAKVYYTNGRTALGGTGTGEEPVEWTSDKPTIIRIDKDTGDIVVLSFTPGNTYVTITATTVRADLNGSRISDSKVIRVTEYTYSYLNTSPELMDYLQGYARELTEYDIMIGLADRDSSAVSSSSFQSSFAGIWGGVSASQVTDLTAENLVFTTARSYMSSDGYRLPSGKAGVNVKLSGASAGAIIPFVYTWTFSGAEIAEILGHDLSETEITATVADEIFSSMRIDFEGSGSSRPVIGLGAVSASDAMRAGALTLTKSDGGKGLNVELTAYVANVSASGVDDGSQLVEGLLVVPDGNGNDGMISGTMWMAGKAGTASTRETGGNAQSSGGGGGGCEVFGMILLVPVMMVRRKR